MGCCESSGSKGSMPMFEVPKKEGGPVIIEGICEPSPSTPKEVRMKAAIIHLLEVNKGESVAVEQLLEYSKDPMSPVHDCIFWKPIGTSGMYAPQEAEYRNYEAADWIQHIRSIMVKEALEMDEVVQAATAGIS